MPVIDPTFSDDDVAAMLADAQALDPTVTEADIRTQIAADQSGYEYRKRRIMLARWKNGLQRF